MIINELPLEILSFIFKFIPIRQTLKLRLVSKKWKSIVDDLKYETLKIFEDYDNQFSEKYKSTSDYDLIIIKNDDLFLLNISGFKFKRIKSLKTYLNGPILLKSALFDLFYELEELTIDIIVDVNRINLNLNKLRKLKCNFIQPQLNLNTPELTELNVNNLNLVKFKYPKKIRKLKLLFLDADDLFKLNQLTNLQFLTLMEDKNQIINNDLIKNLTKLKELNIRTITFSNDHHLIDRLNFKRTNLCIFLKGIKLDHFKMIPNDGIRNRSFDLKGKLLEFLIKNHNLFDYKIKCSIFYCYFNELENLIDKNNQSINQKQTSNQEEDNSSNDKQQLINRNELVKFLDKFNKLETIYLDNEINDEDILLTFIAKSKSNILEINKRCKSLSLSFFNQLSNVITINSLSINENKNLKSDQDYEFLFKMPNLKNISIQQSISIDILIRLIEKVSSINCIINVDKQKNVINFQYDLINYQSTFRNFDEFYGENYRPKISLTINYQPNSSSNNNNNMSLRGLIDNELYMLNNQFNRLDNRVNQFNHHLNEYRLNRIIEEPINLINNIFNNNNNDHYTSSSSSSSSSSSNSSLFGAPINNSDLSSDDDDIEIIHENINENVQENINENVQENVQENDHAMNNDNDDDVEIIFDNHDDNYHNNPIRERRMRFNFDDDYFEDDFFSDTSNSTFSDGSIGYYKVVNFHRKTELVNFLTKLKSEFKLDNENNSRDKFNIEELKIFLQKFNNLNRWRI